MPFQVVFNTVQIGLPPVVLLSAGEDRNVACGDTVFLEGVVDIPENLAGHTILWQQIAGVPVVLSDPNSLSTSYSFVERSDKTFRLWIDKGETYQQFKDISVFHTPKSVCTMSLANSTLVKQLPVADIVECGTISGELTFSVPQPQLDQQDATPCQVTGEPPTAGIDFNFSVSWTVPNTKTELVPHFLDTQLFYADTDTSASPRYTDAPGSIVTHSFFPGGENELKTYYVVTRYEVAGVIITGQSCTVDYTGIQIPGIHAIDDTPLSMSLSDSTINLVKYGNLFLENESLNKMSLSNSSIQIVNYGNIALENACSSQMALSNSAINIIRYDPTGIGS